MKSLYVAFPDIDFMRHIQKALTSLVNDDDFLNAEQNRQREAIVILATAFAKSSSLTKWNKDPLDHTDYINNKLYVGDSPHELEWDVQFCCNPYIKVVYPY